jgi:DNA replication and repair protein RecF
MSRINTGGHKNIIITGPNGSGKTAVLEAVSMLSGDRGLRAATWDEIANSQEPISNFSIFAKLFDDTEISISWKAGDANRTVKINGDKAPLSDLAKLLRIVWLTPREDRLFVDSASVRRSFFDRLISGFDPNHSGRVMRLTKLLSERAFALKNGCDENLLKIIESGIAGMAVAVAYARKAYLSEINYFLPESIKISIDGMLENRGHDALAVESEYRDYLADNRVLIADKMNVDGAHKSDFIVFSNSYNMPAEQLSTGQQKSVLLDLIMAHARLVHIRTQSAPVILLDEAGAHLDDNARTRLFQSLAESDAQVWATGCDIDVFKKIPNAQFVACENGQIF